MKREHFIKKLKNARENEICIVPICLSKDEVKDVFNSIRDRTNVSPVAIQRQDKGKLFQAPT